MGRKVSGLVVFGNLGLSLGFKRLRFIWAKCFNGVLGLQDWVCLEGSKCERFWYWV